MEKKCTWVTIGAYFGIFLIRHNYATTADLRSPEVSTHFSGLSNDEAFFLPMFMRLLNFKPAPYFFFTVEEKKKKRKRWMIFENIFAIRCSRQQHMCLDWSLRNKNEGATHHLCFQGSRHGCPCCSRSLRPRSISRSTLPGSSCQHFSHELDMELQMIKLLLSDQTQVL